MPLFIAGWRRVDKAVIVRAAAFAPVEIVWRAGTRQAAVSTSLRGLATPQVAGEGDPAEVDHVLLHGYLYPF